MNRIEALWVAYTTEGRPFAIAHLICLSIVLWRIAGVYLEARRLRRWDPRSIVDDKRPNSLVGLFNEFAASVRQLGPKGGNVDVGEHLARIQDDVARRETHLNDTIHWFLLIGIAGTLFGLYEFALNVKDLEGTEVVQKVGKSLASAMAKAFPVGFAGVALLVVFQAIAAFFEGRLNASVAAATARAVRFRRQVTVAETDFIDAVRTSISESMAPLRDLGGVLDNSLRPVITAFQARLDQALSIVQTQMEEVKNESARIRSLEREFANAASEVRKTAEILQTFSASVGERIDAINVQSLALQRQSEAAIKFSSELMKMSERREEKLEGIAKTFEVDLEHAVALTDKVYDVVEQVAAVSAEVRNLPVIVADAARTVVPSLVESAGSKLLRDWEKSVREMTSELSRSAATSMSELILKVEQGTDMLTTTISEWRKVNANVESLVKDVIDHAMKSAVAPTLELAAEVKNAIAARRTTVQELDRAVVALRRVFESAQEGVGRLSSDLEQAAGKITRAADDFSLAVAGGARAAERATP